MKNSIRYNGSTNNTSVIIFLNQKVKNSKRWCFARENSRGGFCDVSCCSSFHFCIFIFDLHFVVVSSFVDFLHSHFICFSTSSLTLPWTIAGFLHPFYTFSPAHRRVIHDTFIFNHSVIFLPRALRF